MVFFPDICVLFAFDQHGDKFPMDIQFEIEAKISSEVIFQTSVFVQLLQQNNPHLWTRAVLQSGVK